MIILRLGSLMAFIATRWGRCKVGAYRTVTRKVNVASRRTLSSMRRDGS